MPTGVKGVKTGANGKLTARQEAFVREYLKDYNGTQAAIRAGYKPGAAKVAAAQNLTKANVACALGEAKRKLLNGIEVTQERILREVARNAFSNMTDFATWDENGVRLRASSELGDASRCVAEVSEHTTTIRGVKERHTKFKLHDKTKALDMLMRHTGMYAAADGAAAAIGAITVEMYRKMMDEASGNPSVNVTPSIVDGRNGNGTSNS